MRSIPVTQPIHIEWVSEVRKIPSFEFWIYNQTHVNVGGGGSGSDGKNNNNNNKHWTWHMGDCKSALRIRVYLFVFVQNCPAQIVCLAIHKIK